MVEFDKPQETTYADPAHPGQLSPTRLLPWQRNVSTETHEALGKEINSAEAIQDNAEGVSRAEQAASAIMAGSSTPGFSQALSARANQQYAINKAQNKMSLSSNNVVRQQREMARIGSQLNSMEKLKIENAKGQLRFADQIADYNNNLEISKYQVLGNVLGNVGSFYGGALGGAAKTAKKNTKEDDKGQYYQSGWEDR